MHEWDVLIEATADRVVDEALADALVEHLAPHGPAVSYRDATLAVGFTLDAENAQDAARIAYHAFLQAQPDVQVRHLAVSSAPTAPDSTARILHPA